MAGTLNVVARDSTNTANLSDKTDVSKTYVDWAVNNDFAVIDVNIPHHVTADNVSPVTTSSLPSLSTKLAQDDLGYVVADNEQSRACLLYTSPSPRDRTRSRMPSSA